MKAKLDLLRQERQTLYEEIEEAANQGQEEDDEVEDDTRTPNQGENAEEWAKPDESVMTGRRSTCARRTE